MTTAVKTPAEVRAEFLEAGISVTEWSRVNGFNRTTVVDLLQGRALGLRGQAHRAAVALGLKASRTSHRSPRSAAPARRGGSSSTPTQSKAPSPMNGLLYRATVSIRGTNAPEVHVFFEAPPLTEPGNELLHMLSAVWYAPVGTLHIENIVDEYHYLSRWAVGDKSTGDARLFEVGVGDGGRIAYCDPARTLLLVSPVTLQRLTLGLAAARELAGAGYTRNSEADWQPTDTRVVARDLTITWRGLRLNVQHLGLVAGERVGMLLDEDHGQVMAKVRHLVGGKVVYSKVSLEEAVPA